MADVSKTAGLVIETEPGCGLECGKLKEGRSLMIWFETSDESLCTTALKRVKAVTVIFPAISGKIKNPTNADIAVKNILTSSGSVPGTGGISWANMAAKAAKIIATIRRRMIFKRTGIIPLPGMTKL